MSEKTKYVLLVDDGWSDMTIVRFDDMLDLNHVMFNDDMFIYRINIYGKYRCTKIVKLNSLDVNHCRNINIEDNTMPIRDFYAEDIHELAVRLEMEGYVAELEHKPSCIKDLLENVVVNDDAQHKLVSDMSNRIRELTEENYELRKNLIEVKDRLNDFVDAAKNLNDNKELFKEH